MNINYVNGIEEKLKGLANYQQSFETEITKNPKRRHKIE